MARTRKNGSLMVIRARKPSRPGTKQCKTGRYYKKK